MASSKPIVNSPFKDQVGLKAVPQRGNGGGSYDSEPNLPTGMPSRRSSPDGLPELYRDGGAPRMSKLDQPKTKGGPLTNVPFKDACGR